MFARVDTARHAEAEVEVEALDNLILEVVPFYHSEAVHGLIPDRELDTEIVRIYNRLPIIMIK